MKQIRSDSLVGRREPGAAAARLALAAVAYVALAATALVFLPLRALAQAGSAPCTEITNDTERLACYDRALRPARPTAPAAPAAARDREEPRANAAQPARAPAAAASPPAGASAELGTARKAEPRTARAARAEAAAAAPSAPNAPGSSAAADGIVPIVIVNVRALAGRNDRVFTTDNGVIWVQTDSARLDYPDPPFKAEIKPGMMGSFFLVMGERNRAVRVRRQN